MKIGPGIVPTFVGVKMLLGHSPWKIDTLGSLGVLVAVLASSVIVSLLLPKKPLPGSEEPQPLP